ncbi:MAG: PKD domain-containing protein [Bacteroidetes bacterium]|nr:MAG: PKD domain-containing protein [Bacteroidota bacterium]
MSSTQSSSSLIPSYRVYPLPLENPNSGPSSLLSDPSDITASPYGWHDTDGNAGAEYTITRGNNVFAYDDIANNNTPGLSPDGTASLTFDFPVNFTQQPGTYLEASTTNLFYMNNIIHDILYHYGFDEQGGNFQANNYGRGGLGNDYVEAEAQDGGGTNNANFATPPDGSNGRMQMYLWRGATQSFMTINSPPSIAGSYAAVAAGFGPAVTSTITADIIPVDDGNGNTNDACDPIQNAAALPGKIALITRGSCNFVDKVLAAQNAGAVGVIMMNNTSGAPFAMGDNGNGSSVTIPSVMISLADGNLITGTINGGSTVNGSLNPPSSGSVDRDGSLDNGIIIHEYGHGVSNRLTGGPSNSNCLGSGERGGEGWSDYLSLLFTIEPGDVGTDSRGIGTFALGQLPSGSGIRRFPYSTNMSINAQTYGDLALSGQVHDIGEIWCSALWDMTWGLIDQYGFDNNWYSGTGGNNIALQLVIEGMKLQPCAPGFLDARDAILQADMNLYNGLYRCIIWEAFARRGMGANALQGSAGSTGDETEDFSLPTICLSPTAPPVANFNSDVTSTCYGTVRFNDLSTDIPQFWTWDFGDGNTSSLQHPQHTYQASGTYTVTLIVSNTLGADTLARISYITVNYPAAPAFSGNGNTICPGDSITLTAVPSGSNTIEWLDSTGTAVLSVDPVFTTPALSASNTYLVRQLTPATPVNVGPADNSIGAGGYHSSSFEGRLMFNTSSPVRIISIWTDASGAGNRNVRLYSGTGTLLQTIPVFIPAGQSRVQLNIEIPTPGNYQLGVAAGSNLYRNTAGASYPYSIGGMISITSSNSTTNPTAFYYYLYDWEVSELPCKSVPVPVNVNVGLNPTSAFTYTPSGLSLQFNDNSSANAISWTWDFGDGNTSNMQNPAHTYSVPGTYQISLTVSTSDGCEHTSTQSITVVISALDEADTRETMIHVLNNEIRIRYSLPVNNATVVVRDITAREIARWEGINGIASKHQLVNIAGGCVLVQVITDQSNTIRRVFLK